MVDVLETTAHTKLTSARLIEIEMVITVLKIGIQTNFGGIIIFTIHYNALLN